jgi:prepilin-type N-terminal cleavage/methylation domain-containing protein/prepilin-type processing-associated H-X9-DG protein
MTIGTTATAVARAFTLVELLVVVAIIGLLAAIGFSAVSGMRSVASKTASVANLKNLSTAIYSFAADNNGTLPKATNTAISPNADGNSASHLQVQLINYLVKDRPSGTKWTLFVKALSYPAWLAFNKGTNDNKCPAYIICKDYLFPDGGGGFIPFGTSSKNAMNLAQLQASLERFKGQTNQPYAVIEVDQKLYESATWGNPGWKNNISSNALHGSARNVLYFDGSVRAVPVDQKPYPW